MEIELTSRWTRLNQTKKEFGEDSSIYMSQPFSNSFNTCRQKSHYNQQSYKQFKKMYTRSIGTPRLARESTLNSKKTYKQESQINNKSQNDKKIPSFFRTQTNRSIISTQRIKRAEKRVESLMFDSYCLSKKILRKGLSISDYDLKTQQPYNKIFRGESIMNYSTKRIKSIKGLKVNDLYKINDKIPVNMKVLKSKKSLFNSSNQVKFTKQDSIHGNILYRKCWRLISIRQEIKKKTLLVVPFSIDLRKRLGPSFNMILNQKHGIDLFLQKNLEFCKKNNVDQNRFLEKESDDLYKKEIQIAGFKEQAARRHRIQVQFIEESVREQNTAWKVHIDPSEIITYGNSLQSHVYFDVLRSLRPREYSIKKVVSESKSGESSSMKIGQDNSSYTSKLCHFICQFSLKNTRLSRSFNKIQIFLLRNIHSCKYPHIKFRVNFGEGRSHHQLLGQTLPPKMRKLVESFPFLEVLFIQKERFTVFGVDNQDHQNNGAKKIKSPTIFKKKKNEQKNSKDIDKKSHSLTQKILDYQRVNILDAIQCHNTKKSEKARQHAFKHKNQNFLGFSSFEEQIKAPEEEIYAPSLKMEIYENSYFLEFYLSKEPFSFDSLLHKTEIILADQGEESPNPVKKEILRKRIQNEIKKIEDAVEMPFARIIL